MKVILTCLSLPELLIPRLIGPVYLVLVTLRVLEEYPHRARRLPDNYEIARVYNGGQKHGQDGGMRHREEVR